MPVYIEAEDVNGEIYSWVSDLETLEKLLGHPLDPDIDFATNKIVESKYPTTDGG